MARTKMGQFGSNGNRASGSHTKEQENHEASNRTSDTSFAGSSGHTG
jgi:hypothetical protein